MISLTFGDLAKWHVGKQQSTEIKLNLDRLTQEYTNGIKADLPKHLGFDRLRVAEIDERLGRISAYTDSTANASGFLQTQQLALDAVETNRLALAKTALHAKPSSTAGELALIKEDANSRFADMFRSLNARFAGLSVFSGIKTGARALPKPEAVLTDLANHLDFSKAPADLLSDIKTFFNDPSGRFQTIHYSGGEVAGMERNISEETTVSLGTKATDPRIASVLSSAAAMAVADNMGSKAAQGKLMGLAAQDMQTSQGIIDVKGMIGLNQAKLDQAKTQNSAERTALMIERNQRTGVDKLSTAVELKKVETQLQTHFVLLGRMSKLSLVNFIK